MNLYSILENKFHIHLIELKVIILIRNHLLKILKKLLIILTKNLIKDVIYLNVLSYEYCFL